MSEITKEKLEQLIDLRLEMKEIENKINKLSEKKIGNATDKVKASRADFPYIQGSAMINGFDEQAYNKQRSAIDEKIVLLTQRQRKVEKLEKEITGFINGIEQSKIRRIMQFRYIEGWTWEKIGRTLHCDRTTAEKIVARYMENIKDE